MRRHVKNTSSYFSWTRLFIVRMLACSLYLTIWSRHASFQHALIYPIKFQGIQKAGEIGSHPVYSDPSFLIHGLGKRLVTDVCCFRKTVRRRRAIFSTFVLCCCSLISSILMHLPNWSYYHLLYPPFNAHPRPLPFISHLNCGRERSHNYPQMDGDRMKNVSCMDDHIHRIWLDVDSRLAVV